MDISRGHYVQEDPRVFLEGVRPQIYSILEKKLRKLKSIKFQLALKVTLYQTKKRWLNIF